MPALVPYCALRSGVSICPDGSAGHALLMPRMSLAGSRPMGSSMRFTAKKMEFPACIPNKRHQLTTITSMARNQLLRSIFSTMQCIFLVFWDAMDETAGVVAITGNFRMALGR